MLPQEHVHISTMIEENSFYLIEKVKEFPKKMSWNKSTTMKNMKMKKKPKKEPFF